MEVSRKKRMKCRSNGRIEEGQCGARCVSGCYVGRPLIARRARWSQAGGGEACQGVALQRPRSTTLVFTVTCNAPPGEGGARRCWCWCWCWPFLEAGAGPCAMLHCNCTALHYTALSLILCFCGAFACFFPHACLYLLMLTIHNSQPILRPTSSLATVRVMQIPSIAILH